MTADATISIGLLIALVGVVATIYNFNTAKTTRAKNEGQWQGKVDEKLDTIIKSFNNLELKVDDVKKELHDFKHEVAEELNKLHTRVTVLEKKRTRSVD